MKTIGLIGGMSSESSIGYYRYINQAIKEKLGGLHSAKSIMYSVDFAEIEILQHQGRWAEASGILIEAAKYLENGSADFIVLCTIYDAQGRRRYTSQCQYSIPAYRRRNVSAGKRVRHPNDRVTRHALTMEEDLYKGRLLEKYGLTSVFHNVHCNVIEISVEVPAVEDNVFSLRDIMHGAGIKFPAATLQGFIIPDTDDASAGIDGDLIKLLERLQNLVIAQKMRHGIIAGDNQVEFCSMGVLEVPQICNVKFDFEIPAGRFHSGFFKPACGYIRGC